MNKKLAALLSEVNKKSLSEKDALAERLLKHIKELKGEKGDPGHTPERGKDYWTQQDIDIMYAGFKTEAHAYIEKSISILEESIVAKVRPVKGLDYFDGLPGYNPVKGKDYFDGKDGKMPNHQWDGTKLKFELPDGSWGQEVDLRAQGEKGDPGVAPEHEIEGYKVRFKNPDGTWGEWIDFGLLVQLLMPRLGSPVTPTSTTGSGSGSTDFLGLTDTPDTYVGQASKIVRVKADETGLEFVTGTAGGVDTANSPNAGEYARFTDADTIEGRTEAEFKADMNLEIGTDVQAYSANLDEYAAVNPTAAGLALLDDADASAQRTTLGLGTMAVETATNYVAKALYDAHTVLYATSDNTPVALTVGEQTLVGRVTGGNIAAIAIDSDLSSVSASDDTIPSAKATKAALDLKAPLASPTFTGTVTLPVGLTGVLRADTGVVSVDTDVTDLVTAASTGAAGKVELATTAETETGTDTARAVTPDGLHDMTTLAGAAWFLDEDDFASNSAVKTASQQSIKAYVDAAVAAGVADGDKGDITVSSSGSVWTIDNNVVTYAKMQDISATNRILGRITTGSGDTEELTAADVFSILGITASAAELNILDGATLDVTELNYVDGVTSAIQTQIDSKVASTRTITIAGTANQITSSAGAQDLSANRTWTLSFPSDVIIPTVLTVPNTGLHILDTNASHDLIIAAGSNLTADHTLTLTTGDADRTLDLGSNLTIPADPNADRILFWDDSAGATAYLAVGNSIAITLTTIDTIQDIRTTANPQFATIELGHASANTLSASGGVLSIEGVELLRVSGGTLTGSINLGENTGIALDPAGSADGKWSGITIAGTAGYTQAFGDLVTLDKDDSRWEAVDISVAAAATGDARGILGMVVSAGTDGNACTILLQGTIRADANFPALTIGAPVYASTSGDIVVTQPSTTDHVIRIVGMALTGDEIYFNPSNDYITHT